MLPAALRALEEEAGLLYDETKVARSGQLMQVRQAPGPCSHAAQLKQAISLNLMVSYSSFHS